MSSPALFEENLDAIERAIARVCRDAGLARENAEDFGSSARIALLADDCAILRKFEGRSSMATYLTIVVRRLLVDSQRAAGRWFASAEAVRRGPAAVLLERLMVRERRPFSEVTELVRRDHPEVSRHEMEEIAAALPRRMPRPTLVPVSDEDEARLAGTTSAADRVDALDLAQRSGHANAAIRSAMTAMTAQDRVILRLRFTCNASIASIARSLGVEQRPLYRRIEALLGTLRRALEEAGVDGASAAGLIGAPGEMLNFGFDRKSGDPHPSLEEEGT